MPVTADEVQQQIILEVGDVDPATGDPPTDPASGIIAVRMSYLWDRYAAWDSVSPGLRELHVRAAGIRLVLGVLAPRRFNHADGRSGLSVSANQLYTNYVTMLESCYDEIKLAKAAAGIGAPVGAGASSPFQVGRLAKRSSLPAYGLPDPNDLRYGGTVPQANPTSTAVPGDEVT